MKDEHKRIQTLLQPLYASKREWHGFQSVWVKQRRESIFTSYLTKISNYRWWPIPHFSGIYFVCICAHICLTGYNELFLGKSIKIAINFYTKATSRNCVVIDYSFCQAARVVSEKTSFSCCTTHICKGLIEILSHPWSIKIVKIEVAGFKSYIPTRTCSKTQFQMLIEIPFRLL